MGSIPGGRSGTAALGSMNLVILVISSALRLLDKFLALGRLASSDPGALGDFGCR